MSIYKYLTNIFSRSPVVDSASAIAHEYDTTNALSTAGAKLASWSNGGTEKIAISYEGGLSVNSGATTAAHAQSVNLQWGATGAKTSTGLYSCVIGTNNTASNQAAVAIGQNNTASGQAAVALGVGADATALKSVALGTGGGTAAGDYSLALGGWALGEYSVAIGPNSKASAQYSVAIGMSDATIKRSISFGSWQFSSTGDQQAVMVVAAIATTDATQATLAPYNDRLTIPADTTWAFSALISARSDEADGNNAAIFKIEGGLMRDELNNTVLVGTPFITVVAATTDALPWTVVAEADDTNEALAIKVTGEAATNIRWVAKVDISQVTFA